MSPRLTSVEQNLGRILLLLLVVACLLVVLPFVSALLWAAVLSFAVWPLHARVLSTLGNRRTLAATVTTLSIATAILLPFVVVGLTLADSVEQLTAATRKWLGDGVPPPPDWLGSVPLIGPRAVETWRSFAADGGKLWESVRGAVEPVAAWLLQAGLTLGGGLVQLALSILMSFFLLRDGPAVADLLARVIERIAGPSGRRMLTIAGNTVRGVVHGILGTALIQAVMAGLGFAVAGVPGAALLGLLTFFLSVLPMGPPLVWIPAAIWLFHTGETGWGVFMVVWGILVSSIDNVVKPWLISQGSDMPFLLIFLGVLGGALAFGFIGVFLGPTLLAVGYRLTAEWIASFRAGTAPADEPPGTAPGT
jgi:predicted PurR-regulated permease PerM